MAFYYYHSKQLFFVKCSPLFAGDEVQVVYIFGEDTTPLYQTSSYYTSGFTGFRI